MGLKLLCLIMALLSVSLIEVLSQDYVPSKEGYEDVPTKSEINITTAELQTLLEELIYFKKKRMKQLAGKQQQILYPRQSSNVNNDQDFIRRLSEIEKLIVQMNERLVILQKNNSSPESADYFEERNLDIFRSELQGELASMRKAIQELSITPPSVTPQLESGEATTDKQALQSYFMSYTTQMMSLRQSIDSLEAQLNGLLDKSDYRALERQLSQIEKKIQSPIILHVEKDSFIQQKGQPIIGMEAMAYWDAQLEELRTLISKLQPEQHTLKERIITEAAPPDTSFNWLKRIIAGKEKRHLGYENNSFQINQEHIAVLQETTSLMQQYGELDLLIVGYTSKTGTPSYNKLLSQNRAEEAKKYLMKQGIHPSRIFTEYHGIDYHANNPAQGRRVDLVLMVRR